MDKAQSKYNNTAVKMRKALFALLEETEFKDITISNICQMAKVNRSTFYAHYDNTFDLLEEAQEDFIAEFFTRFKLKASDIDSLTEEEANFITTDYLIPFLQFIKDNKKIYNVYMCNLDIFRSQKVYDFMFKVVFVPICNKYGLTDQKVINYMAHFYLVGITAIVRNWLKGGCEESVLYISEVIMLCVRADKKGKFNF